MKTTPINPHTRDIEPDANNIAEIIAKKLTEVSANLGKNEKFEVMEVHYHRTRAGTQHLDFELSLNGVDYDGGSYSLGESEDRIYVINDAVRNPDNTWGACYGYLQFCPKNGWGMELDPVHVVTFNS